jgi:uncharacterized cupredoxin-like copper-binding protein
MRMRLEKIARVAVFAATPLLTILPALAADMTMDGEHMTMDAMNAEHHGPSAWGEPGDAKNADRTVTIEATEIAFNVKNLAFRKGETVRFVFTNKGEQPHEFMIADHAEELEHRQMMQQMTDMTDEPNAVSVDPGETKVLVWTFTNAGRFDFACNYPGHAEAGMDGKITVE